MNANDYISHLGLLPHPEGGFYKETYRSAESVDFTGFKSKRNVCTAIYFLIESGNFSALHRIKSDEVWHFYAGDALEVIEIDENGSVISTVVGNDVVKGQVPQYTVKARRWFGSRVAAEGKFSLVGCTVAPGFDFRDFEMASRDALIAQFPQHTNLIKEMTRL